MFKRAYTAAVPDLPAAVVNCLRVSPPTHRKSHRVRGISQELAYAAPVTLRLFCLFLFKDVDRWSFDVFALNSASSDHALETLFFELLTKYELNSRFKV